MTDNEKKRSGFTRFIDKVPKTLHIFTSTISKAFDKIVYNRKASLVVSILAAIVICLAVNYSEISDMFFNRDTTTLNLPAVSVDAQYDADKYAVTGLPSSVSLTVSGSPADIQVFRAQQSAVTVTADLTKFAEGENVVELVPTGIPDNLTVTADPSSATVDLIRKTTRSFTVKPELLLGSGQKAADFETPELSQTKVKITATPDQLNSIRVVTAYVDASGQTGDFTTEAVVSAYNASGEKVAVETDPATVTATVKAAAKNTQ